MRKIENYGGGESAEEQLKKFSVEELFFQLSEDNKRLAKLGVEVSISSMADGAARYGRLYEDRRLRREKTLLKATPMNFLMTLIHSQPDLLKLSRDKFCELGGVVSRAAMVTEVLEERGPFQWPEQFAQSPQAQLPPKNP